MSLTYFLEKVKNLQTISFAETIAAINENYSYQPCAFSNGLNEDLLTNSAGTNEGSCRIFAFAQIHHLSQQETLNLFGDYYHVEVLADPEGTGHQNIRNFIKYGWEGIAFEGNVLTPIV